MFRSKFEILSQNLREGMRKTTKNLSGYMECRTRFEAVTSRIRSRSDTEVINSGNIINKTLNQI
jgi:hypothetical protein